MLSKVKKETIIRCSVALLVLIALIIFLRFPYTSEVTYNKHFPPTSNAVYIDCKDTDDNLKITYNYGTIIEFLCTNEDDVAAIIYNEKIYTAKQARQIYMTLNTDK